MSTSSFLEVKSQKMLSSESEGAGHSPEVILVVVCADCSESCKNLRSWPSKNDPAWQSQLTVPAAQSLLLYSSKQSRNQTAYPLSNWLQIPVAELLNCPSWKLLYPAKQLIHCPTDFSIPVAELLNCPSWKLLYPGRVRRSLPSYLTWDFWKVENPSLSLDTALDTLQYSLTINGMHRSIESFNKEVS